MLLSLMSELNVFTFYDIYFMICNVNNVVLPKKTRDVHFIASLNIFSVALFIIRTSANLDKGSLTVSPN
jgi:hypothetical protein